MWFIRTLASIRATRVMTGAALLIALASMPASAGPLPTVPPDVRKGVTGEVWTIDQGDMSGVACRFTDELEPRLLGVAASPPAVAWPDRRPAHPDEHGRVSWRLIIQAAPVPTEGPWKRIARSALRTGTATEQQPAKLTGVTVKLDPADGTWIRVIHKVTWYRKDGSVLGTLRRGQAWSSMLIADQEMAVLLWHCPAVNPVAP